MNQYGTTEEIKWSEACNHNEQLYAKYIGSVYLRQCIQAIERFGTVNVEVAGLLGGTKGGDASRFYTEGGSSVDEFVSRSGSDVGDAVRRDQFFGASRLEEHKGECESVGKQNEVAVGGFKSCVETTSGQGAVDDLRRFGAGHSPVGSKDEGSGHVAAQRQCGDMIGTTTGGVATEVEPAVRRGKNYARNLAKRIKRKNERKHDGFRVPVVDSDSDSRSELQKSYEARRIAENKLAVQKAEFQLKRNEYMTKSRVAELEWETRRLQTDQKLAKISEARLGSKPGFAETLIENNISSTSLPSLSKGTISPDSSISVDEVRKMEKLIETMSGQIQSLTTELNGLKKSIRDDRPFGGKHDLDENDKIIIPRFKTPDERLEWMNSLSDKELEALGPDFHRDGRRVEDGSRLSFDGYTEDYSLQDEAMKEAGITMIG